MQVVNMSASIQSQSSTRSAQSSSRDGTGGINQPSDVCGSNKLSHLGAVAFWRVKQFTAHTLVSMKIFPFLYDDE